MDEWGEVFFYKSNQIKFIILTKKNRAVAPCKLNCLKKKVIQKTSIKTHTQKKELNT